MRKSAHSRAFTLIELLVVVAIIGVLIALLLPSLNAARDAARNAICIGNLRQIAIGQFNYAIDRKDYTFWTQMWNPNFVFFRNVAAGQNPGGCDAKPWLLKLMASPNYRIFYCPRGTLGADDPNYGWNSPSSGDVVINITYSLVSIREPTPYQLAQPTTYTYPNVFADQPAPTFLAPSTGNRPNRLTDVQTPDKLAVATDAQRAYYSGVSFSYPGYTATPWSQASYDFVYPHRRNDGNWDGTTTSYFDGHATFAKRENLGALTSAPSASAKYWMSKGGTGAQLPMWW